HAVAGVVDQHVDGESAPGDLAAQALWRSGVAEVGLDRLGAHRIALLQLGAKLIEAVSAPRGQDQVCAARGELARDRRADAGRSAGNERPSRSEGVLDHGQVRVAEREAFAVGYRTTNGDVRESRCPLRRVPGRLDSSKPAPMKGRMDPW